MKTKMMSLVPEEMPERAPYHLLCSIAAPRPITWISTVNASGVSNLAPFSFYNAVAGFPPTVMFSISYRVQRKPRIKDTLRNVEEVGEFVAHVVDEQLADAMILTSADFPPGVDEFEIAELETVPSLDVRPPRIAAASVAMECKVTQIVPVEGATNVMVLGQVVRFHVRDDLLRPNGLVDAKIGELFHLEIPDPDILLQNRF